MTIRNSFFIASVILLVTAPTAGLCASSSVVAAADASLAAYEQGLQAYEGRRASAGPAQMPQWRLSLSEIQETSAVLLETNSKLTAEAAAIGAQAEALQVRADARRARNAEIQDEIDQLRERNDDNGAGSDLARFKEILAERRRQVEAQQEVLAALGARQATAVNRLSLARMKLAQLEIDKKAAAVDVRAREESAVANAQAELARIRENISKAQQQVAFLQEKTEELKRIDKPFLPQMRDVAAQNVELRARLGALQAKAASQKAVLDELLARKAQLARERNIVRVDQLRGEREVLQGRLKDNSTRLQAIREMVAEMGQPLPADARAMVEKLEKQNTQMADEITNLRENVALLEYKVTTLERYKNRRK